MLSSNDGSMEELVDSRHLKCRVPKGACGFESRSSYYEEKIIQNMNIKIKVSWFEWLQCQTVDLYGTGSSPVGTAIINKLKTYENNETKTLVVYVS